MLTQDKLLQRCWVIRGSFDETILKKSKSYEIKGIFNSEMLMFIGITLDLQPDIIIESGRARGQSTEIIARWVKEMNEPVLGFEKLSEKYPFRFISIESNSQTIDVDIAEARCKDLPVELLYGDSREIMPKIADDYPDKKILCLIDGPKGSGMTKLFQEMLNKPNVCGVAMHDSYQGSSVRNFLEANYKGKFLISDDKEFVEAFKDLDDECWKVNPWGPYEMGSFMQNVVTNLHPCKSYAGTLSFVGK